MLIAGGQDLLILFLGLELLVLPGYLLAGFAKRDGLSTEGAIKYFLLGSFSSAIFLFGLAFVLGYHRHRRSCRDRRASSRGLSTAASRCRWRWPWAWRCWRWACSSRSPRCPSTTGRPTPTRVRRPRSPATSRSAPRSPPSRSSCASSWKALAPLRGEWALIIGVLAAITMTVGNLAALGQDNIKRMLAYSSIAHTGYIMVGLVVFATADDADRGRGRHPGRALLQRRLRLHEPGCLRGGGGAPAATRRHQPAHDVRRPGLSGRHPGAAR